MLTAKQNLRECVKGGKPDRVVNQYEGIALLFHPFLLSSPLMNKGDPPTVNAWGVTNYFPDNVPGAFPVHTPDKIVVKDIEHWRDYVHAPSLKFPDELWNVCKGMYAAVDGEKAYKATFIAPGIFEQTHHLCEIERALTYYMVYEDEMHDLVKYLTDWELELAEGICSNLHPDAIFHHDDWGSEQNSFMRPSMFEDFFLDAYKQIYGYYHDHGVELIVHHSDSYGATLVPSMIEMGIDVWQGCMSSNDLPELTRKYCGKIGFMGGFDGADFDYEGWTPEETKKKVWALLDACTPKAFIPCIAQGGPGSVYPGVYEALRDIIDEYNEEHFGVKKEEIVRSPIQYEKIGYM